MNTSVKHVRGGERPVVKNDPSALRNGNGHTQRKAIPVPQKKETCLFVLDTNVLMHDPTALEKFEEHSIYLPGMVIEELDNNKKGKEDVNRNAREVLRTCKKILTSKIPKVKGGIPLASFFGGKVSGYLYFQTEEIPDIKDTDKPDNQILSVVKHLNKNRKGNQRVILVTKDTAMHVKAEAAGIAVQDYQNDMITLDDKDFLPKGYTELPPNFWDVNKTESYKEGHTVCYKVTGPGVKKFMPNEFVHSTTHGKNLTMRMMSRTGNTATFHAVVDHTNEKNLVAGIRAKNNEQNHALNLLMDPNIDIVTLVGTAGSGKTLLALAAAIAQTIDTTRYNEIIITRATVSVGEDIGFLPGTEEDKMGPWMGALEDNLDVLSATTSTAAAHKKFVKGPLKTFQEAGTASIAAWKELARSRIKIRSMNFMRGRTFHGKYVIIDEFQNLTIKQAKTLITRAGVGTKIVCLGNLTQIDTPYLTEGSSGLTHVVKKYLDWGHSGHVIMPKGERSRLADSANDRL